MMMGIIFISLSAVLVILIALLLNEKPSQKGINPIEQNNDTILQVRTISGGQNTAKSPAPRVIRSTANPSIVKNTQNGIRVQIQARQDRSCFHCGHMNKDVEENFVCCFCGRTNDSKEDTVKVIL